MEDLRPEKTVLTAQTPENAGKRRFTYSIASIGIFAALLMFLIAVGVLGFISFYYIDTFCGTALRLRHRGGV